MAWITYEDVEGVVAKALDDGVTPHLISTRFIRDRLGSGGLSTISNNLKKYWAEHAAVGVSADIVASEKVQELHRVVADIVVEQTAEVRANAEARAKQDGVRIAAIEDDLAFATDTNGQLEIMISARDAEIIGLGRTLASAQDAAARLEGELSAAGASADREQVRLVSERDVARAETVQAQVRCAEATGKLDIYERERAEMFQDAANVVAGHSASEAKIERLQGALEELRRERAMAIDPATSTAAPTLVSQTPPVEAPHPPVQAGSTGEVNG